MYPSSITGEGHRLLRFIVVIQAAQYELDRSGDNEQFAFGTAGRGFPQGF
ncbi:hypothetical protein [Paenibacillus sp. sgz5001063]